jgi:hypothetical protein
VLVRGGHCQNPPLAQRRRATRLHRLILNDLSVTL